MKILSKSLILISIRSRSQPAASHNEEPYEEPYEYCKVITIKFLDRQAWAV